MATLDEVRRVVFPGAALLAAGDAADRTVTWVRVLRPRVPAFDALEAGDLAIIPEPVLVALAAGAVAPAGLVDELDRGGVPALLLVGESEATPAAVRELADVAAEHRLPTFRVVGGDVAALERSVIGFLVNRRAEVERRASELVAQVEQLALEGRDLDSLAGAVAAFLARGVAIENRAGTPVVVHAPDGVPDVTAAAARYLAQPRSAALRVTLPGGEVLALLGGPVGDLERTAAERVGPLIALEISRGVQLRRARDASHADQLPPDGPPWVLIFARQIDPQRTVPVEVRSALRDRIAALEAPGRIVLRGDVSSLEYRVVAAVEPGDPLGLRISARLASAIDRLAAVSRPFSDPAERPLAEAEARATLEAAEELVATGEALPPDRVARADRVAAYRLLGQLHNLPGGTRLADALLAPLKVGRPAEQAERIATLRALLDNESAAAAAHALGVHRNTLLYRAARIESMTGWRLDDPQLRLALSLALRLVQTAQSGGAG